MPKTTDDPEDNNTGLEEENADQQALDKVREENAKYKSLYEITMVNLKEAESQLRVKKLRNAKMKQGKFISELQLSHLLSEQHNATSHLEMDSMTSASIIQNQHMLSELTLRQETQGLQSDVREMKLHDLNLVKEVKTKQGVDSMELANHYETEVRNVEAKQRKMMESIAEAKKFNAELEEIDEKMKSRIKTMEENNDRTLINAEESLYPQMIAVMTEQRELNEELLKLKKEMMDTERLGCMKETCLATLQAASQRRSELQKEEEERVKFRGERLSTKARLKQKLLDRQIRALTMKSEFLRGLTETVEEECVELKKNYVKDMVDLEQENGLKKLLLQRKMQVLTETLAKAEAKLSILRPSPGLLEPNFSQLGDDPPSIETSRTATDHTTKGRDCPPVSLYEQNLSKAP